MAKYNPKFQINLQRVFNNAYASSDNALKRKLRENLNRSSFRATFGKMVIDKIIERTLSGIDRYDIEFRAYSNSYKNSDIFKIYAKSAGEINLKLTGEMLASMTAKGSGPILSIELIGDENKAKAHGHVYGIRTKKGGKVRRDFLGLPEDELYELMRNAVTIVSNDAYEDAIQFYEGLTVADIVGQVGLQPELAVNLFSDEVLAILASENI